MNKTFFIIALISLVVACKDPGVNTQGTNTDTTAASSEKTPEEVADSTVRAIKRNFESTSPAASFDSFRKAVLIGDGSTVSDLAGEGTLEYYAGIYKKVMTARKGEIQALPVGEHQMVLMSRLLLPQRGLSDMDTKTFLKNLVETGSLDKVALGIIKADNIIVDGNTAKSAAFIFNKPQNQSIDFVQSEDGEWKINMKGVIEMAADHYHNKFTGMRKDPNTHVANSVAPFTPGGEFNESLYQPLK